MQRTPADIDRLDLAQALVADRLVIALADQKVVLDDAAERGERQDDRFARPVRRRADLHQQPVFLDRQMQVERPGATGQRRELVALEQIGDRRGALVLDRAAAPDHGPLVQGDFRDTLRLAHAPTHRRLSLIDNDSACASSPSASARRIAAGASVPRLAASQPTIVLRFMKSRTPRPEAKRALRAVGKTWFGPAMYSP